MRRYIRTVWFLVDHDTPDLKLFQTISAGADALGYEIELYSTDDHQSDIGKYVKMVKESA